ncbi:Serine/threonine-protein kinase smg-1 [Diplonema papillatum]|nr:Serine/threonine-protein kinase smg-1 [Diplonema papillatum]
MPQDTAIGWQQEQATEYANDWSALHATRLYDSSEVVKGGGAMQALQRGSALLPGPISSPVVFMREFNGHAAAPSQLVGGYQPAIAPPEVSAAPLIPSPSKPPQPQQQQQQLQQQPQPQAAIGILQPVHQPLQQQQQQQQQGGVGRVSAGPPWPVAPLQHPILPVNRAHNGGHVLPMVLHTATQQQQQPQQQQQQLDLSKMDEQLPPPQQQQQLQQLQQKPQQRQQHLAQHALQNQPHQQQQQQQPRLYVQQQPQVLGAPPQHGSSAAQQAKHDNNTQQQQQQQPGANGLPQSLTQFLLVVKRDTHAGEADSLQRHAPQLIDFMRTTTDPKAMSRILEALSEIGQTHAFALSNVWPELVDYLLGWYIAPETTSALLSTLDTAIVKLDVLWQHNCAHTTTLLLKLIDGVRELSDTLQHSESDLAQAASAVQTGGPFAEQALSIRNVYTTSNATGGDQRVKGVMRFVACILLIQQAAGAALLEVIGTVAPVLLSVFTESCRFLSQDADWVCVAVQCVHKLMAVVSRERAELIQHSKALGKFCSRLLSHHPSIQNPAIASELVGLINLLLAAEVQSTICVPASLETLDVVELAVTSASRTVQEFVVPNLSQLCVYSIDRMNAANEYNFFVSEATRRLRAVTHHNSSTQKVITFYLQVLDTAVSRPEQGLPVYLSLMNQPNNWVEMLPNSGQAGLNLLKALSCPKWKQPPVNPIAHSAMAIHVAVDVLSAYVDSSAAETLNFEPKLRLLTLTWVKHALHLMYTSFCQARTMTEKLWNVVSVSLRHSNAGIRLEALRVAELCIRVSGKLGLGPFHEKVYRGLWHMFMDHDDAVRNLVFLTYCRQLNDPARPPVEATGEGGKGLVDWGVAVMRPRQFGLLWAGVRGLKDMGDVVVQVVKALCVMGVKDGGVERPTSMHDSMVMAVGSAARYCVQEKVKTVLGNAAATFEEIEKALRSVGLSSLMIDDNYTTLKNHGASVLSSPKPSASKPAASSSFGLQPLGSKILFLLATELERWVFLAQEGYTPCDQRKPGWLKSATIFFATNKKVTEDYFTRLRIHLVAAGDALSCRMHDSMFMRSCGLRLAEMQTYISQPGLSPDVLCRIFFEMEKVLLTMCHVHIRRQSGSDPVTGYARWAQSLVDSHIAADVHHEKVHTIVHHCAPILWNTLTAMAKHAAGRYEEAMACYQKVVDLGAVKHAQLSVLRMITLHYTDCCIRSLNLGLLDPWVQEIKRQIEMEASAGVNGEVQAGKERKLGFMLSEVVKVYEAGPSSACTQTALSMEYAKALGEWETGRNEACLRMATATDEKIKVLLTHTRNPDGCRSANCFTIDPALLARIRVLRTVADRTRNNGAAGDTSLEMHIVNLLEALALLQSDQASGVTEEAAMLGNLIGVLKDGVSLPSIRYADMAILLGHKIDKSCLLSVPEPHWARALAPVFLEAAQKARRDGNRRLSAKLLSKLKGLASSVPGLQEWGLKGGYEQGLLQLEAESPEAIRTGLTNLWNIATGDSPIACSALLKLHELVTSHEQAGVYTHYVASLAKVHHTEVGSTLTQTVKVQFSGRKDALCRYASWCLNSGAMATPGAWLEAVRSHVAALAMAKTDGEEPLVDVKLALRLLKLLQQSAAGGLLLRESQVAEVLRLPVRIWLDISPQLMAHVASAVPLMRLIVMKLLRAVGNEKPMLLLYPLVAALGTAKAGSRQSFQDLWNSIATGDAIPCFNATRRFVSELIRITELPDEQTNAVVASLVQALSKVLPAYRSFVRARLGSLEKLTSAAALSDPTNPSPTPPDGRNRRHPANGAQHSAPEMKFNLLKRQKFEALLQPLAQIIEQHLTRLKATPQCLHDSVHVLDALPKLERGLHELKTHGGIQNSVLDIDAAVEAAHGTLLSHFSNLSKTLSEGDWKPTCLALSDISVPLAELQRSLVPVPGTQDESVTITRLDQTVDIVSSKTRPKKMQIWGSDGARYTFLLKGKEDLSLDERVMQVLRTVTVLLGTSDAGREKGLTARAYAVVPLSHRSGLIRFVDNVYPVFHLHRQWVKRRATLDQLLQAQKKPVAAGPAAVAKPAPTFRPVHHFFTKLLPALKEVGINNVGTRTDWPLEVLTNVFGVLSAEVPKDLLSRELWSRGTSYAMGVPSECGLVGWLRRMKQYASSLAVMSVVGYIIGLGDRHLDNILIDFDTGEIVHIDYNICFEKGLQLRVPEIVPFRLTNCLQHALGIQGVRGTFQSVCEDTLSVLRSSKETLLNLLEAFVHDPLVEWTAKRVSDPATEGMEVKVSLSVLGTHLDEILGDLTDAWHKCSAPVATLTSAVDELRSSKHAEVVRAAREKNHRVSQLLQTIATVEDELESIANNSLNRDTCAKSITEFNSARAHFAKQYQQFVKVQADCNDAHRIVLDRSLIALPDDPPGYGTSEVERVSSKLAAQPLGDMEDALLPALSKLAHEEMSVLPFIQSHKQRAAVLVEHLTKWADIVSTIERANPGLRYSEKNYCHFWLQMYKRLLDAGEQFGSGGIPEGATYSTFQEAVDRQSGVLERTVQDVFDDRVCRGHVAPYLMFGSSLEQVQQQAVELSSFVEPLKLEIQAMQQKRQTAPLNVEWLNAAVNTCTSPQFSLLCAAALVLSEVPGRIPMQHDASASNGGMVHSWERSVSLRELEENDDPLLFLHVKWDTFTGYRKAVSHLELVTDMVKAHLTDGSGEAQAHAEVASSLRSTVDATETLLSGFTEQLFSELSKAVVANDETLRTELDNFKATGGGIRSSMEVGATTGTVLLEAIRGSLQGYASTISNTLAQVQRRGRAHGSSRDGSQQQQPPPLIFLKGDGAGGRVRSVAKDASMPQVVAAFVDEEVDETLRMVIDECLSSVHHPKPQAGDVPPLGPAYYKKHLFLRRTLCILRSFVAVIIEAVLAPAVVSAIEDLVRSVMASFSVVASTLVHKKTASMTISPASAGVLAQIEDLLSGIADSRHDGRALREQTHNVRDCLRSVCEEGAGLQIARLATRVQEYHKDALYYRHLQTDVEVALLNHHWLLGPVVVPGVPAAAPAQPVQFALQRKAIVDSLEQQYLLHKLSAQELARRLAPLAAAEDGVAAAAAELRLDGFHRAASSLAAARREKFAAVLRHHDEICQASKKVVFLEVLRNMSQQNETIHARVMEDAKQGLAAFNALTRNVAAVAYRVCATLATVPTPFVLHKRQLERKCSTMLPDKK